MACPRRVISALGTGEHQVGVKRICWRLDSLQFSWSTCCTNCGASGTLRPARFARLMMQALGTESESRHRSRTVVQVPSCGEAASDLGTHTTLLLLLIMQAANGTATASSSLGWKPLTSGHSLQQQAWLCLLSQTNASLSTDRLQR